MTLDIMGLEIQGSTIPNANETNGNRLLVFKLLFSLFLGQNITVGTRVLVKSKSPLKIQITSINRPLSQRDLK